MVIENCVFESRIRSRVRESGTLKRFVFKNNRCVNTSFESDDPADTGGGENSIVLESNVFENDRQNSVCAVTLRLCGHSASVCNNVIKGDGGAAGILVSELSSGGTGRAFIDNNKIEGFRETVTVSAVKDITVSGSDIKGEIK